MVALKGKAITAFVAKRDPAIAAVLIYGPDAGLVRERALILAKSVVDDLKDPFNAIELTDQDLKEEPGRLADEAAALSFAGGERLVRIRTTGEGAAKAAKTLIDGLDGGHISPNALVVIEGGDLSPRSGLRKAFEKAKRAAALPCYADGAADIRTLAAEAANAEGFTFDSDALDIAVAALGDDRGLSRSELEKLFLYMGPPSPDKERILISVDDVRACLIDGLGDVMDDTAAACADGRPTALSDALFRAESAGASPIGILRVLHRQFSRLLDARRRVDNGASPADAMKSLKPPVFYAEKRAFEALLRDWQTPKLAAAQRMLTETELEAKRTGAPQRELVERAALRLSMMAKR